jgi:hypothetical protein
LERLNQPYHFEAVNKSPGGWTANTLRKADAVRRAMSRYPGKRIVLLDVDCSVSGDLTPLSSIDCDIALFLRTRQKTKQWYSWLRVRWKTPPALLQPRSGTMLFVPTEATHHLVERWSWHSRNARFGSDDETTLATAIGEGAGLTVHALKSKWAAVAAMPDTVVLHVSAHAKQPRRTLFAGSNTAPISLPDF